MNSTLATPVLVLNANFAPINVCSVRRAIGLMMQDKASLVMNGRGYIQTVRNSFPVPSIIRLQYMIKRPRPIVKLSKREIFRRDGYTCQYCGQRSRRLTIDHVIPKHLGGPHTWTNLVTACSSCNHKKGGRTLERVPNMKLRSEPKEPPATAHYIFGQYLSRNEAWMDFIVGW